MKICLIVPPKAYYKDSFKAGENADVGVPIGLLTIAAVLEQKKHKVKIIDCIADKRSIEQKKSKDFTIYGITNRDLISDINKFNPDIVGISNMFSAQILTAIDLVNCIKHNYPNIPTIIGGPHVSVKGEQLLKDNKNFDFAIFGEGEYTLVELIEALTANKPVSSIKGLIYRTNKEIIKNLARNFIEPLDNLPFPAYHLVEMDNYLAHSKRNAYSRNIGEDRCITMITSRGCPFNCFFCSIHLHMGRKWRAHSSNYVISHIKFLINNYNIKQIHFEDDNLTANKKRFAEILNQIIEQKLNIKWDTPNGVRADTLDDSLIKKAKKSGCMSLKIGIESGDQEVLTKIVRKNLKLEKVIEIAKICKKNKLSLGGFYIIGFPGETKENMERTAKFAKMLYRKYNVTQGGATQATPLYGTKMYEICKEKGYLTRAVTPESLSTSSLPFSKSLINTPEFNQTDLDRINKILVKEVYIDFLRHPFKTVKMLYKLRKRVLEKLKELFYKT